MSFPLLRIRASSLAFWPDCERRQACKIIPKEIAAAGFTLQRENAQNIGAVVGNAVHFAGAKILQEKMASGTIAPVSVATDAAMESLKTATDAGEISYDKETPSVWDAQAIAVRMARQFRTEVAPQINPIAVEERLEAEAAPGVILSGQSDTIATEPDSVVDLKTGKRRGTYKAQLGGYSLLNRSHGRKIKRTREAFIQRLSMKKEQPPAVFIEHSLVAAETAAINVIHRIADAVGKFRETGDPWSFMANPNSMLCSAKWCPAHGTDFCHEHKDSET